MKLAAITLFLLILLPVIGSAQQEQNDKPTEDTYAVVLLNNGATIRGNIYEKKEGKYIRIRMQNGVEFKLKYKDIYVITDEENYARLKEEFRQKREIEEKKSGPKIRPMIMTLGGAYITKDKTGYQVTAIGFHHTTGGSYIGLGLSYLTEVQKDGKIVVLGEYRRLGLLGKSNLFFFTNLGLIFQMESGFGLNIPIDNFNLIIQSSFKYLTGSNDSGDEKNYTGLAVNIGFSY